MEPMDLWDQYLEGRFRDRVVTSERTYPYLASVDGQPLADFARSPKEKANDQPHLSWYSDAVEHHFDAASNLRAMDREGVDVSVHFPTCGLQAIWLDGLDPQLSSAICRAYNDWLADWRPRTRPRATSERAAGRVRKPSVRGRAHARGG
jgi:hypothetical protein